MFQDHCRIRTHLHGAAMCTGGCETTTCCSTHADPYPEDAVIERPPAVEAIAAGHALVRASVARFLARLEPPEERLKRRAWVDHDHL